MESLHEVSEKANFLEVVKEISGMSVIRGSTVIELRVIECDQLIEGRESFVADRLL